MMLEKVDPSVVGLSQERLERVTRWLEQQVGEGKLAGRARSSRDAEKLLTCIAPVLPTRKRARYSPPIPSCASTL